MTFMDEFNVNDFVTQPTPWRKLLGSQALVACRTAIDDVHEVIVAAITDDDQLIRLHPIGWRRVQAVQLIYQIKGTDLMVALRASTVQLNEANAKIEKLEGEIDALKRQQLIAKNTSRIVAG